MKKIIKILFMVILIITLTGCGTSVIEKKEITNKAFNYFTNKYNIDKKDIKINYNHLYGKNEKCFNGCYDNVLSISYNNKEYHIIYNEIADFFGDNYQYEEVHADLLTYLNNKFPYAAKVDANVLLLVDINGTPEKYNGNIKEYFKIIKEFYDNHRYLNSEDRMDDQSLNTWISVYIEAKNSEEARDLNNKYSKEIINELEELGTKYVIVISADSEYSEESSFYHYKAHGKNLYIIDNVDNQKKQCERNKLKYEMCY